MTDTELSALEAAAKAATPGPWRYEDPLILQQLDKTHWRGVDTDTPNNMSYIAAANPAAILELIAELRQTEIERDWLAEVLAKDSGEPKEDWICAARHIQWEATSCQK